MTLTDIDNYDGKQLSIEFDMGLFGNCNNFRSF